MFFYAFKWFAMAEAMWRYPSWEERLQSKELGNLCLTSERSITATCFAQSTLKGTVFSWQLCFPFNCTICREKNKSQGYVNEILCLYGGKFTSPSIDIESKYMTLKLCVIFIVSRSFYDLKNVFFFFFHCCNPCKFLFFIYLFFWVKLHMSPFPNNKVGSQQKNSKRMAHRVLFLRHHGHASAIFEGR